MHSERSEKGMEFYMNLKKIIKKNKKIYKFLKGVISYCKYLCMNIKTIIFQLVFLLCPINKNKIVVTNFYGKAYGDNPKYIIEELIKDYSKVEIVWFVNDIEYSKKLFPKEIKLVKYGSIKAIYEQATAKALIDNSRRDYFLLKRKKQFYIQTWHGTIALKKVENDVVDTLEKRYIRKAKFDSKSADLFVSGSKFMSELYRKSFWYNKTIVEYGTPEADILINNKITVEQKESYKEKLKIDKNKKIVLYAPTFRSYNNLDCYNIDFKELISNLNKKTGDNWVILLRLHPNIAIKSHELSNIYANDVIDVSSYPDIYELMLLSDICISDYSTVIFEFSFMKKPVFLYATDIEDYLKDRGFYFDIYNLPFQLAVNNDELIKNINNFDYKQYLNKLNVFYGDVCLYETGHASKKVAEIIIDVINNRFDSNIKYINCQGDDK